MLWKGISNRLFDLVLYVGSLRLIMPKQSILQFWQVLKELPRMTKFWLFFSQIQFILIGLHQSQVFLPMCRHAGLRNMGYMVLFQTAVYFYLFYDFYKNAYKKQGKQAKSNWIKKVKNVTWSEEHSDFQTIQVIEFL